MVNHTEALERLRKEKDYEDNLVKDLSNYFLSCLDNINDISEEEKEKTRDTLKTIMTESQTHSHLFNELIQHVMENGENNY